MKENFSKQEGGIDASIRKIDSVICRHLDSIEDSSRGAISQDILEQLMKFVNHIMLKFYVNGSDIEVNEENIAKATEFAQVNSDLHTLLLPELDDESVIKQLTAIKGIGNWTAKMYLIFVLDRQDILPTEDVAFLQAYKWLYKTTDRSPASITNKCTKWKPYSSIAARYLYRALDSGLTKTEFHLYK